MCLGGCVVNGAPILQMRTPRPRGGRGTIKGHTGLRLGPRSLTSLLRSLLCMAPPLGRGPLHLHPAHGYPFLPPSPGNLVASGPRLDLRPRVHCSRGGHHATVPEEAIRGPEDPGVHVCPLSHPLHLHQDFSEYQLQGGCLLSLQMLSIGHSLLLAGWVEGRIGEMKNGSIERHCIICSH